MSLIIEIAYWTLFAVALVVFLVGGIGWVLATGGWITRPEKYDTERRPDSG